ncbi:response regulator [Roseospira visakhapatnamensis]|uniref:Two-component system chemotaxis response regulator CheY n=1 Tax=Roseospira visakhapatnamensis TaxID=390880 RepID=A0A7W6WAA0_9PROT|nr:response regulator [Roseospira visakhapatnamensis]MBB4266764.1 two-component system chemotaxis response regulator CheY [Roseospira visakhapatnamensis]
MSALRVLVVDDSLITVTKITTILTDLGHAVVGTAGTGEGAVESYRHLTPDLVTMDITMPDMDGVEATRMIINEFPDATIIMVTSHGQERLLFNSLEAGAKGYLLKPIKRDKLARIIEKARTRLG